MAVAIRRATGSVKAGARQPLLAQACPASRWARLAGGGPAPYGRPVPRLLLLLLLLAPVARAEAVELRYAVLALGGTVLEVTAEFATDERGYRVEAVSRLTGAVRIFARGEMRTVVEGTWRGGQAMPVRYLHEGLWRGEQRRTEMEFPAGLPTLRQRLPATLRQEHEEVPQAMLGGTRDVISTALSLARQVERDQRCDARLVSYDGGRLQEWLLRTEGRQQVVAAGGRYREQALRCAITGRTVAGFRRDEARGDDARLLQGIVWFGQVVPAAPPLPVRVEIETRLLGTARIELVSVTAP